MNTAHFLAVVKAEARAIYGRPSAKLAVVVALICGVGVLLALQWLSGQAANIEANGNPVTQMVEFSGPAAAGWGLRVRNFFVLPLVLLLATASSFAGELGDQTLREALVRPVPRWWILLSKTLVLASLAALTLVITLVPAFGGGAALFGMEGPTGWVDVLLGYGASLLSDLGLIALGLLASTFVRSVGGVVVSMMLILMGDMGARAVLKGMSWLGADWADGVGRALPGNALACWEGWTGDWDPWSFVGLALLLLVGFGGAWVRFSRMDVP